MNFTLKIKYELMNKKMSNQELNYFLDGCLYCANLLKEKTFIIKIINNDFYNFLIFILKTLKIDFETRKNQIIISNYEINNIPENNVNHFFSGMFFISGSISNLNSSSYHLQINFKDEKKCENIINFSRKHFIFNKTKNKNNYVIYIKKNEKISDFLHVIGTQKSYFEFIDSIISRDMKNQVTRIFNLDLHNQEKLVNSYQNFLENYDFIIKNNLDFKFTKEQLIFFEFKKQNQFMPLSEISTELYKQKNIKKSKSGLNH